MKDKRFYRQTNIDTKRHTKWELWRIKEVSCWTKKIKKIKRKKLKAKVSSIDVRKVRCLSSDENFSDKNRDKCETFERGDWWSQQDHCWRDKRLCNELGRLNLTSTKSHLFHACTQNEAKIEFNFASFVTNGKVWSNFPVRIDSRWVQVETSLTHSNHWN